MGSLFVYRSWVAIIDVCGIICYYFMKKRKAL